MPEAAVFQTLQTLKSLATIAAPHDSRPSFIEKIYNRKRRQP